MGRASYGVKGIELGKIDEVVALEAVSAKDGKITILSVTEKGFGKRTVLEEYRKTARAAKGVITLDVSERTGNVIDALSVKDKDSIIVSTTKGMTIRVKVKEIRVMGRATQGVHIVKLKEEDKVADVTKVPSDEEINSVFERLENASPQNAVQAKL
jgi:DNA gyrase subunit A